MLQPRPTLPSRRRASLRRQGLLSVPEGVSDANPARNSRLEVPRSAGAAERIPYGAPSGAVRLGSPCDMKEAEPCDPASREEGRGSSRSAGS